VPSTVPDRQAQSTSKSFGRPALYLLVLVAVCLAALILRPFVVALTWALIFAILFRRLQVALEPKVGRNGGALITTLVVAIVIVAPTVVLISSLAREMPQVTDYLQHASQSAPRQIQGIWDAVRARSPVPMTADPRDLAIEGARRAVTFLAPHAGAFVADLFTTLGTLVAMLFALFFMLRDRDALSQQLRERLPLPQHESDRLISETHDLVVASVGAGLVVAAAQGFIGGVAFWLLGIGAPVFWGVVMGFASLLPLLGAALVWFPAAIALLLSGEIGRGVVLLLVGVFGISMADNVLRPLLLSGRTSMSGFVVFFGLLGGAAAFGFIGLVIGPIILVTAGRLLENLRHPELPDEAALKDQSVAAGGG